MPIHDDLRLITRQFEAALAHEKEARSVEARVRAVARDQGRQPSTEDIDEAFVFVRDYIERVPQIIQAALDTTEGEGEVQLRALMKVAVAYWVREDDVIPDSAGLLGLLDDAYFTLRLLAELSDRLLTEVGVPLFEEDLAVANDPVRYLFTSEEAETLDDLVAAAISEPSVERLLLELGQAGPEVRTSSVGAGDPRSATRTLELVRENFTRPPSPTAPVPWKAGRVLVALGYLGILAFPLGYWFDAHHFGSDQWFIHAKFHILWKTMLMTLAGATGFWLVVKRWQPSTARTLAAWVPVVVWTTHTVAHVIMALAFEEDAFPHHDVRYFGVSAADVSILVNLLLATIGATLDGRAARRRG